jgi:hypothetical protein
VPAFIRIFEIRDLLLLMIFEVYGICHTDGIAQTATRAFFNVKDGWHLPPSREMLVILR